jgi:hypothetical protein
MIDSKISTAVTNIDSKIFTINNTASKMSTIINNVELHVQSHQIIFI